MFFLSRDGCVRVAALDHRHCSRAGGSSGASMSTPNLQIRAQAIRLLELMAERYPNLRLGQILINAMPGTDMFYVSDEEFTRELNQSLVTYTQFEAAKVKI